MKKNLILVFLGLLLFASGAYISGSSKQNSQISKDKFAATPIVSPKASSEVKDKSIVQEGNSGQYPVTKVIDGDTIDVLIEGKTETLRLIGVDTPETVDPRKPVQCFGKEASNFTKQSLTGKNVDLELDPSQGEGDKYKRLLRYVILNGINFNKTLIEEGYAHEYTYNIPYKYQAEFKEAQKIAMENKKGLWADDACSETVSKPAEKTYQPQGTYTCNCQKLCGAISTCDEAYYQLQNCGCSARDSDGDGVPCESICR